MLINIMKENLSGFLRQNSQKYDRIEISFYIFFVFSRLTVFSPLEA